MRPGLVPTPACPCERKESSQQPELPVAWYRCRCRCSCARHHLTLRLPAPAFLNHPPPQKTICIPPPSNYSAIHLLSFSHCLSSYYPLFPLPLHSHPFLRATQAQHPHALILHCLDCIITLYCYLYLSTIIPNTVRNKEKTEGVTKKTKEREPHDFRPSTSQNRRRRLSSHALSTAQSHLTDQITQHSSPPKSSISQRTVRNVEKLCGRTRQGNRVSVCPGAWSVPKPHTIHSTFETLPRARKQRLVHFQH